MMTNGIKLSVWAKRNGLTYKGAYRLFKVGKLPHRTIQLPTGTIIVYPEETGVADAAALYGRVSSHDQKADLQRQMDRLRAFAAAKGLRVVDEKQEIGSGLNGHRKLLLKLLAAKDVQTIVVEHRDRLSRFGFEYIEAALSAAGKTLLVLNDGEQELDLVQDFIDVVTSMCARIYGQRSAKNRARRALEATRED